MRLLLNTESIRYPLTGIGNYTACLFAECVRSSEISEVLCYDGTSWLSPSKQQNVIEAVRSCTADSAADSTARTNKFRNFVRAIPGAQRLRGRLDIRRFHRVNVDQAIYHEPNYILRPVESPSVATIHDLSFMKFPEYHPKERVRWMAGNIVGSLEQARKVIVDSQIVKKDLLDFFSIAEDKIVAVHLGVDRDRFKPVSEVKVFERLRMHGLSEREYVLFVGTLEPRKGIDKLLSAWKILPRATRERFQLVLVGSMGWKNDSLMGEINRLSALGEVRYLNYLPDEVLPAFYTGAACFVYPSIYEGFGLPALEALSCGCPVVAYKATSIEEFAGNVGSFADHGSTESLSYELSRLLDDEEERKIKSRLGINLARELSWSNCVTKTAVVYRSALS